MRAVGAAAAVGLVALSLSSRGTAEPAAIDAVTVTATRLAQRPFDVPSSIDAVGIEADALQVNASESLRGVPGLIANDRQNYAQDTQISIRGFGARSTFGIRGVRIYVDGIPATQPDGQGQVAQFNLATADRIEVLRGPVSALYGNSSGGVIQLFTATGRGPLRLDAGAAYGSFDTWRASTGGRGSEGRLSYNVGYTQFSTAGSRGHSAASRGTAQAKLGLDFASDGQLTLLLNYFNSPDAQDPLGLTHSQFDAGAQQAASAAQQFNSRKSADQRQAGAIYDLPLDGGNALRLMVYAGHRDVLQFLALPVAAQSSPNSSGGVVDLGTNYGGAEPRWSYQSETGVFTLLAGLSADTLRQRRRGYNDYAGAMLGVRGALRRDELDEVQDFDQYLQAEWQIASRWALLAGLRHSEVRFRSTDDYVSPGSSTNGGERSYGAGVPVGALMWHATARLNVYASLGDGFETPTFAELAYRPDGGAGLNLGLRAARTRSVETGAKLRFGDRGTVNLAVFRADSSGELIVVSNSGGRSTYGNAGRTRREGFELSLEAPLSQRTALQLAYTELNARVRSAYATCTGTTCLVPTTIVAAGNRIPGVPPRDLYAALKAELRADWSASLTGRYVAAMYADDANRTYAGAYGLLDLATDYGVQVAGGRLRGFVRLDNLLNRRYAGSVIVNESQGRYFEAGPGRAVLVGLSYEYH